VDDVAELGPGVSENATDIRNKRVHTGI
jgi:hypothetical protein